MGIEMENLQRETVGLGVCQTCGLIGAHEKCMRIWSATDHLLATIRTIPMCIVSSSLRSPPSNREA